MAAGFNLEAGRGENVKMTQFGVACRHDNEELDSVNLGCLCAQEKLMRCADL